MSCQDFYPLLVALAIACICALHVPPALGHVRLGMAIVGIVLALLAALLTVVC